MWTFGTLLPFVQQSLSHYAMVRLVNWLVGTLA